MLFQSRIRPERLWGRLQESVKSQRNLAQWRATWYRSDCKAHTKACLCFSVLLHVAEKQRQAPLRENACGQGVAVGVIAGVGLGSGVGLGVGVGRGVGVGVGVAVGVTAGVPWS